MSGAYDKVRGGVTICGWIMCTLPLTRIIAENNTNTTLEFEKHALVH